MKIIIVGTGKVGSILVEQLSSENHDIVVIDTNADALKQITERYDVMGIIGNGATVEVQREAGVDKTDLLIATTNLDECNLLACLVARNLGARHTIARVRNPEYASQMAYLKNDLGISMTINPELEASAEISRVLRYPSALKINPFARGRVEMVEIKIQDDSPIAGMSLFQLRNKYQLKILLCAVARGDELYVPGGSFVLQEGDRITLIGTPADVDTFFGKIGIVKTKIKSVMIVGAGKIGYYLTRQLLSMKISVKIIDQDPVRCRELCELLPDATVICGNGSDQELLTAEGLHSTDSFVALTGLDEENMIISVCANTVGVKKVIAKVNNISLAPVLNQLGLDTVISPKRLTADRIVKYARCMQNYEDSKIETLHKLLDGKAEAVEFHVSGEADICGKPLKDFKFKPQILIACIVRQGTTIIADGNTVIQKGDNVIVISGMGALNNIEEILL